MRRATVVLVVSLCSLLLLIHTASVGATKEEDLETLRATLHDGEHQDILDRSAYIDSLRGKSILDVGEVDLNEFEHEAQPQ